MRAAGSPLYLAPRSDGRPSRTGDHLSRIAEEEVRILQDCYSMINAGTLREIAACLAQARRLYFSGFRNSSFVAGYARALFALARSDVEMLHGDLDTLGEGLADPMSGDAVVVAALRRRPVWFRSYMSALKETGADIILISDTTVRETPAMARWTLLCPVQTVMEVDTYVGVFSLARLLAIETLRELGFDGRRRLERIESLHEDLSELE
jgi:DNA-binding MurR/RpiR family transcriptional regulator